MTAKKVITVTLKWMLKAITMKNKNLSKNESQCRHGRFLFNQRLSWEVFPWVGVHRSFRILALAIYMWSVTCGHFNPSRKVSAEGESVEADEEFVVTGGTEDDDEQTLEEEERMEGESDHKNEIDNLQKEGRILKCLLCSGHLHVS